MKAAHPNFHKEEVLWLHSETSLKKKKNFYNIIYINISHKILLNSK